MRAIHDHIVLNLANLWIYLRYFRVVWLHVRLTGSLPNPAFPRDLNDKFLWRKVFDRNPEFVPASDKLESRALARKRCPDIQLPKTLWVGADAADIPPEVLNGDVVVKATHGSGYFFPIFAGKYDREDLENRAKTWMRRTYGKRHFEWSYFGLEPKLYVEEMVLDKPGEYGTAEAKMYVYCGQIQMILVIYDRLQKSSAAILRGDWSASSDSNSIGAEDAPAPSIDNRAEIEQAALRLCAGFDHVRCDLYLKGNEIYFGEYTVYNQGGYIILPTDRMLHEAQNKAWDIRQSWFLTTPQHGWLKWYAASLTRQLSN